MAQGDSWDNPYIIHNYTEFIASRSATSGKYYRFADIHVNGSSYDIVGDGSYYNPYQVSTYKELLYVTGASFVYECRLVDFNVENPTAIRKYVYGTDDNLIYCAFDPTDSTIDFNDISQEYIGPIEIYNHYDFNGWTFLNPRLTLSGGVSAVLTCGNNSSSSASVHNLIMLNCMAHAENTIHDSVLFCVDVEDSILHITLDATDLGDKQVLFNLGASYGMGFKRNSLVLTVNGTADSRFAGSGSGSANIQDSVLDLNIKIGSVGWTSGNGYLDVLRSTIKGKIDCNSYTSYFYGAVHDCIFDCICTNPAMPTPAFYSASVYNKEKVGWTDHTGLIGVTSEQLLSPTALQAAGLSIGVDT